MQKINKNKATKIGFHFAVRTTYAVYCIDKNIILYNYDYDKTCCGIIYFQRE